MKKKREKEGKEEKYWKGKQKGEGRGKIVNVEEVEANEKRQGTETKEEGRK